MALVRTFTLPHYEAYPIHVALFKDVKNASYLRSQLLEANPDFDYAFLDAEMVGNMVHGGVYCYRSHLWSFRLAS
jgi:EKC/KEOPS complex subunit CGI121/TPRKB